MRIGVILLLYLDRNKQRFGRNPDMDLRARPGFGFQLQLPARFVSEDRRGRKAFVSLLCLKGR